MRIDCRGDFRLWQRVELVEEKDSRGCILASAAFGSEFVADFAAGDQNTVGVLHFGVRDKGEKTGTREVLDVRSGIGMAEHAFGRKYDEWLTPRATRLAAKQMEILRGVGGLADIHVAFRSELQEALDARTGVLRALAFVAMGKQKGDPGRKPPLVFAGADKLIDDDLRAVDEVAELRFPQNESVGIVARKVVLEAKASCFGERGVVNFAKSLRGRQMRQWQVLVLVLGIHENRMALVKGAALGILAGKADWIAFEHQRTVGEKFGEAVVHGTLSLTHLQALLEQFLDFRMDVKTIGCAHQTLGNRNKLVAGEAGIHFEGRVVLTVVERRPVVRQLAKVRNFSEPAGLALRFFVFALYSGGQGVRGDSGFLRVDFP